jgi:glutathione peroxidase
VYRRAKAESGVPTIRDVIQSKVLKVERKRVKLVFLSVLAALMMAPSFAAADDAKAVTPLAGTVKDIDGKEVDLAGYKGKVVLVVNVASKCGYTPQYTGLEALYQKYKDKGFTIIAFPANNFHGQEPGTNAEIKAFCTAADSKYHVTFPLMAKISVKGDDKHAVYKELTKFPAGDKKGDEVAWNFEKFLIGKDGSVVGRFRSAVTPTDAALTGAIEKELGK